MQRSTRTTHGDITLRFHPISPEAFSNSAILKSTDPQGMRRVLRESLRTLGISVQPGETQTQAFWRAMARENGLHPDRRALEAIVNELRRQPDAMRYYLLLD